MAVHERGLGRGLGALLNSAMENTAETTSQLALSQLVPGKQQPRKYFNDSALAELAASIKKQGIIQPLLVRLLPGRPERYEIVAGERRWRAAKLAGLTRVPVIITEYNDKEAMTVALVENLQREDLNPLEEASAMQTLRDAHGLSQEELADQLGKSRSAVANALRLLQLPALVQEGLAAEKISAGHARALLSVKEAVLQEQLYAAVLEYHLSVRETETAADCCKKNGRLPEKLLPQGTTASTKPKRTPKTQYIREVQNLLRQHSGTRATITGNDSRGRIQIPYSSAEELKRILNILGMAEIRRTNEQ